jgi:hypothetical protein
MLIACVVWFVCVCSDLAHELELGTRSIKVVRKERELEHIDLMKSFKLEEGKRISELRREFERRSDELKAAYARKMTLVRKKYGDIRKREVAVIEERKAIQIQQLIEKHKKVCHSVWRCSLGALSPCVV